MTCLRCGNEEVDYRHVVDGACLPCRAGVSSGPWRAIERADLTDDDDKANLPPYFDLRIGAEEHSLTGFLPAADARLLAEARSMLVALIEISRAVGSYSSDPAQHAVNCINDMQRLAKVAAEKALALDVPTIEASR